MLKRFAFVMCLMAAPALFAQNPRAAIGGDSSLWASAEFSSFNPDFYCKNNSPISCRNQVRGPAAVVDLDLGRKLGIEGEARWLHWNGLWQQTQSNYLIGPHYCVACFNRLNGWIKFEVGEGTANIPFSGGRNVNGTYLVYAPGATLNYKLTRRLAMRLDYEFQVWPSFAGPPTGSTQHDNGLTPNGFSLGFTYLAFGHSSR